MYPEYARNTLTDYVTRPRREDFTIDTDAAVTAITELRPAVVILASPNNPPGRPCRWRTSAGSLRRPAAGGPCWEPSSLTGEASDCVVVIDEAYAEFRRPGVPSALELLGPNNPHLAVTRTMSKAFGAAGLRLGYLAADRTLVEALRIVRLPYHLSAVTQAAALAALSHRDELMAQVASLRDERDALVAWLRGRGLTAHESDANFVLFGPFPDREAVWQALLDAGVLIRASAPRASCGPVSARLRRVERLRSALAAVIGG